MVNDLIGAMNEAIDALKENSARELSLFHHNDSDGLSSGTILLNAFTQCGYRVSRFSLEKPYPQVLEKILAQKDQIIIFADFAGRIAPMISKINNGNNTVIILDHHPAEQVDDSSVYNLDGELFGLKGDRDISASSTCYLFAQALLKRSGLRGDIYSHLGVLGAVGDGFLVDGCLSGVNRDLLKTAVEQELMRVEKTDSGEDYYIKLGGKEYPAGVICTALDTVGGVGYYGDGTSRGIDICQSGMDSETAKYLDDLKQRKDAVFAWEIENLKNNIHTTEHIQWFNVEERFQPMGVKMIGVFLTYIKDMDFLDKTKYLAGFQIVPDSVPGFDNITFDSTKISMRVSEYLTHKIRSGEIPGLSSILPEATANIGGFSDACHGLSAATTVKIGQEKLLIQEIEKVLNSKDGE